MGHSALGLRMKVPKPDRHVIHAHSARLIGFFRQLLWFSAALFFASSAIAQRPQVGETLVPFPSSTTDNESRLRARPSDELGIRLSRLEDEVERQRIENGQLRQELARQQGLLATERTDLALPSVIDSSSRSIDSDSSFDHREPGIAWLNGFRLETANRDFVLHVGGMAQGDGIWLTGNPDDVLAVPGGGSNGVGLADAVDLRRARLLLAGTVYEVYDWALQFDFANTLKDDAGQGVPNAVDAPRR